MRNFHRCFPEHARKALPQSSRSTQIVLPNFAALPVANEKRSRRPGLLRFFVPRLGRCHSTSETIHARPVKIARPRVTHGQHVTTSIKEGARKLPYVPAAAKTTFKSGHSATHFKAKMDGNL